MPLAVAAVPVQASAASTAPAATVKAHRLADVRVAAHKAVSFTALGVAGVPKTGVAAVVIKLTASKPLASGALVAYAAGGKRPSVLSVSFTAGHDASNTVIVVPGKGGKVTAYNGSVGAVRVIPTVVGYYRTLTSASAAGSYFHPVTPRRLTSTLVKKAGSFTVASTGLAGVPAAAATVIVQLSVANPGAKGVLTVSPAAGKRSKATALAFVAGRSGTALVKATPGAKGRLLVVSTAKVAVRVQVDVVGYLLAYAPPVAAAPTAVTATAQPAGAVVMWTAPVVSASAPVLSYAVVVANGATTPIRTVVTVGPVTSLAVTGLSNGTPYTFAVYAVTKNGNGKSSAFTAPVTPAGVPAAPTGVTAAASAAGSATVTWTAPAANGSALTGYKVTGAPAGPVSISAAATTTTISGLTVGQRYTFTVSATNALGSSPESAASLAIIVTGGAGSLVTSPVSVDTAELFHGSGVATGTVSTSANGQFVAFSSASGLAGTDANGQPDVFLRDRTAGTTALISVNTGGTATTTNGAFSLDTSISSDGTVVAFDSTAPDLVTGDTNGREDVFVRTPATPATVQASLTDTGTEPDRESYGPALSANGRFVAFASNATNLISTPTPEVNDGYNIYLRDLTTNAITRISRATDGGLPAPAAATRISAPTISPDGRYVGYTSAATNIVTGDTNGAVDAFVFDTTNNTTVRVSVGAGGVQANGASSAPSFSLDDRYAVFQSDASNLVAGDTNGKSDVFVRDLVAGTTTRVSVGNDGSQGNDSSTAPSISSDGTRVLFTSLATNLVVGDTNGVADAFVRYLGTNETVRVSVGANSVQAGPGPDPSVVVGGAALSGDGKTALFTSADALAAADTNGKPDLWARTLG
ncbi:hypothetical protein acdb102_00850 [Acidothermaceae bacterium B102]|nr:hypothetical protein acdb102_00850 [Acidothermaceae bacterium B102]